MPQRLKPTLAVITTVLIVAASSALFSISVGATASSAATESPALVEPSAWQIVPASNPGSVKDSKWDGISCAGPSFCIAVGGIYAGNYLPIAAKWDGSKWTSLTSSLVLPPGDSAMPDEWDTRLFSVSCVSSAWCVAVGYSSSPSHPNGLPLVEQWNGSTWSFVAAPGVNESSNFNAFRGVSCSSTTYCVAVGATAKISSVPLIDQWNGTSWSVESAPGNFSDIADLNAVSCVATWCEGVGSNANDPLAMTNASGSWKTVATPSATTPSQLNGVSCYSPSLCMAAGIQDNNTAIPTSYNLVEQWSGTAWVVDKAPDANTNFGDSLSGVDCFGPTSCVATGYADSEFGGQMTVNQVLAWNGASWSVQEVPTLHGADLGNLAGVDCVPNNLCLSVGSTNTYGGIGTTQALTASIARPGYEEVASDGGLFSFGAPFFGSMGGQPLNEPIVGMARTPDGGGYWEVASDGGLFAFGDAAFYGSMGGQPLNAPIVGMTPTVDGRGYFEVASDGGLFAFGDAQFHGSMGGQPLNAPIVGIALTPDGGGYYEVASDGGLFSFGNAIFHGSMGGQPLNAPIVGIAVTPSGGYYEVASDGGLFAFGGALFHGSMGGMPLNAPIVGMTVLPSGGYYEVASDGGLFAFGGALFHGSMGGQPLNKPIVGIGA
jgi:hypothetical protein